VCSDGEWNEQYQSCLDCALEFDIWRYYGGGLGAAAEECGLPTTPDNSSEEQTTESVPAEVVPTTAAASEPIETVQPTQVVGDATEDERTHSETPSWGTTSVTTETVGSNGVGYPSFKAAKQN
jgi:hypothetical protein